MGTVEAIRASTVFETKTCYKFDERGFCAVSLFLTFAEAKYNAAVAEIDNQNDRGCILICASLLESILLETIETRFRNRNSRIEAQFVKGYGPLSTFRAKIDFAYLIGICNNDAHTNMLIIKTIRNKMAHEITALDFSSKEIVDKTNLLPSPREICLSWKASSDWFRHPSRILSAEDRNAADRIFVGIAGVAASSEDTPRQRFVLYIRHRIIALQLAAGGGPRDEAIEFIWRDQL